MLDQEAMQIARTRLSADSARRHHFFQTELQQVQSELATKGLGQSGALVQAVANVCAKEIEDATVHLWELLRELLHPSSDTLSAEAVSTLHRQIDELWIPYCSAEPGNQFDSICRQYTFAPALRSATHFDDRSMAAGQRIHADADQLIRSMRQRSDARAVNNRIVFLSHAAADERIACCLRRRSSADYPASMYFVRATQLIYHRAPDGQPQFNRLYKNRPC